LTYDYYEKTRLANKPKHYIPEYRPMRTIRSSLVISFVTRYTSLILTLAGSIIIARLLTPEEIGIFAVGAVIIGFAQTMRAFGVGSYLVQEKELNEVKIRAAFMVTLCMAWIMGVITLAVAPWAGDFYKAPDVSDCHHGDVY
jgi:O-antigen/teichoic acid export membrane protein